MKNPHIRGLGEAVLRVKNLEVMKDFYARVLGLEIMKEFEGIAFWDALDYIGLNNYYPLPDDLSTGAVVARVEAVQRKFKRPVIFTEAGFSSYEAPHRAPWDETPRRLALAVREDATKPTWRWRADNTNEAVTRSGDAVGRKSAERRSATQYRRACSPIGREGTGGIRLSVGMPTA